MSEREKTLERRGVHRDLAARLTTMRKEASFTIRDGIKVEGIIRPLGGGEIARAFQAAGVELSELNTDAKMTWAKMLAQFQIISRAFTANDGRTFTPGELEELIMFDELSKGEISALAGEIFELSGLSRREAEITTGKETGQPLESFRSK